MENWHFVDTIESLAEFYDEFIGLKKEKEMNDEFIRRIIMIVKKYRKLLDDLEKQLKDLERRVKEIEEKKNK